ncbi:hypothetical protein [Hyphomonas atlantica]
MTAPRLRQLVIAAETLEAADQLGESDHPDMGLFEELGDDIFLHTWHC